MRSFIYGAMFGLGVGIVAWLLLHSGYDRRKEGASSAREPSPVTDDGRSFPAATLGSPSEGDESIHARLAAVEAEMRRVADALTAVSRQPASPAPAPTSASSGVRLTDSVETIRAAWSAVIDKQEKSLEPDRPRDGKPSVIYEAYMFDIRNLRRSLQDARTIEDLQRLAAEHPNTFKFDTSR